MTDTIKLNGFRELSQTEMEKVDGGDKGGFFHTIGTGVGWALAKLAEGWSHIEPIDPSLFKK